MKPDKRKIWWHDGCKVVPICCQHPFWGMTRDPVRFRDVYRNRFWRIYFPDESWVEVETRASAKEYIRKHGHKYQSTNNLLDK